MRDLNHHSGSILRKIGTSVDEVEVTDHGAVRWKIVPAEYPSPANAAQVSELLSGAIDLAWENELRVYRDASDAEDPWDR